MYLISKAMFLPLTGVDVAGKNEKLLMGSTAWTVKFYVTPSSS